MKKWIETMWINMYWCKEFIFDREQVNKQKMNQPLIPWGQHLMGTKNDIHILPANTAIYTSKEWS